MATESKNPWETFECDLSAENFNEPQELFNNIKLNHFPFLKRHFPFVDYLVKCKLCDVILLPQTIVSHYENRHGSSKFPTMQGNSELLPYQAVSCYNDRIDTSIKKERNVTKRNKNASRRLKRGASSVERDIGSLETISETDSLSSLTDDAVKRLPVPFHEDDIDHLREPVLLKLAKSECNPNGIDGIKPVIPKSDIDNKSSHGDRSVWSVVYSKEGLNSQTSQRIKAKSQAGFSQSSENTPQDSGCGTQSNESVSRASGATTHRASSYPPTPALSPHPSSPTPSNVSDGAVFFSGKLRSEQVDRSRSRSSTHSSSSGASTLNEQHELYDNSHSSPWCQPDFRGTASESKRKAGPAGRMHSRRARRTQTVISSQLEHAGTSGSQSHSQTGRLEDRDVEVDPYSNPFEFQDNTDIEYPDPSCSSDRFIPGTHHINHSNKELTVRNGYLAWLKQVRGGRTGAILQGDGGIVRGGYFPHPTDWRRVSGHHSDVSFMGHGAGCATWTELPQPSSSSARNRSSIQNAVDVEKSYRVSTSPLSGTIQEASEGNQDDTFDPLTQCGCIVVGNLRCRNSLLCLVHTVEEKRLVPRQRDLRQLMLEARERQMSRSVAGAIGRRPYARAVPDSELSSPVIDLTDDVSGSESLDDSAENAEAVNNLRMGMIGNQMHAGSRILFRGSSAMDAQTLFNSNNRRRAKLLETYSVGSQLCELSHIPPRIGRRIAQRDGSYLFQPGAPYEPEVDDFGESIPTVCPNVAVEPAGNEQYLTVRHGTLPSTDNHFLSESANVPGLDLSTAIYPTRLIAISGRPGSSLPMSQGSSRKPLRRPPQLRRAQPVVGLQWSANGSDSSCDPVLTHSPSGVSNSPMTLTFEEAEQYELMDRIQPGDFASMSGHSVDGATVPDTSFRGRMISTSAPIMLSTPVPQLPYDCHSMLERQPTHSTQLVNPSATVNRFARSLYGGGAQVVRESQGRVVVDDTREKSITGRSRKTARTTFRHVAPVFPSSSFTGVLHPRYQYSSGQPPVTVAAATVPAFMTGALKPNSVSSGQCASRSTVFARPVAGTSSDVCLNPLAAGLSSLNAPNESAVSVIRRPSLISRPLLKSSRFLANGPCGFDPEINVFHPVPLECTPLPSSSSSSSTNPSDPIDLDGIIQTSNLSLPSNVAHLPSGTTVYCSSGTESTVYAPLSVESQRSAPASSNAQSSFAASASNESANSVVCRNRYFVIRPGPVRPSTGLVVRARRPDSCSLYSATDDASQQQLPPPQQQQQQPPPSAEAS